jgi:hypothetical protein
MEDKSEQKMKTILNRNFYVDKITTFYGEEL